MADSILTPGYNEPILDDNPIIPEKEIYLKIDNCLSELVDNLGDVYDNLNISSRDEVNRAIINLITSALESYQISDDDEKRILDQVEEKLENVAKLDGNNTFSRLPKSTAEPTKSSELVNKKYVDNLVTQHTEYDEDPHGIKSILEDYALTKNVYSTKDLYTKTEVKNLLVEVLKSYIKLDGTTAFTKPQLGVDPKTSSHLTTKRYVDNKLESHLTDIDPHGFTKTLNSRLASYIKKKDVFDKTLTYSRTQIDTIIDQIVNNSIDYAIADYKESVDDKFEYIRKSKYTKSDGSVPFKSPLVGVDAVNDNELVTLGLINNLIQSNQESVSKLTDGGVWKTSGPVESTVGHVEDDSPMPEQMTLQEIMDAIFYGKGISLDVPDYVVIKETTEIILCVHGSTTLIDYGEVYQNGELIHIILKEEFENGCVTKESLPINEDTEFTFKLYYTNDTSYEESKVVKCSLPMFAGLLPKWKFPNTITMEYLNEIEDDQNQFIESTPNLTSFTIKYQFKDSELKKPFIVVPRDYPDLETMTTKSQSFGIDAFDVITNIPLVIPGISPDKIFKIYTYKQALSSLNQEVTFNFKE